MTREHEAVFNIGVVAKLTGLHEQTIRQYERIGLVAPHRSPGGTRVFSEIDVTRLKSISSLTRDMGVNLAGVEIILRMRDRQEQLVTIIRELYSHLDETTRVRFESFLHGDEPGLVPTGESKLAQRAPRRGRRRIEIKDADED